MSRMPRGKRQREEEVEEVSEAAAFERFVGRHHGGSGRQYMADKRRKMVDQQAKERFKVVDEALLFSGLHFWIDGYVPMGQLVLEKAITAYGGNVINTLTKRVQIVLLTNTTYDKMMSLKKGNRRGRRYLRPEWVVDSIAAGRLLGYTEYDILQSSSRTSPWGSISSSSSSSSSSPSSSFVSFVIQWKNLAKVAAGKAGAKATCFRDVVSWLCKDQEPGLYVGMSKKEVEKKLGSEFVSVCTLEQLDQCTEKFHQACTDAFPGGSLKRRRRWEIVCQLKRQSSDNDEMCQRIKERLTRYLKDNKVAPELDLAEFFGQLTSTAPLKSKFAQFSPAPSLISRTFPSGYLKSEWQPHAVLESMVRIFFQRYPDLVASRNGCFTLQIQTSDKGVENFELFPDKGLQSLTIGAITKWMAENVRSIKVVTGFSIQFLVDRPEPDRQEPINLVDSSPEKGQSTLTLRKRLARPVVQTLPKERGVIEVSADGTDFDIEAYFDANAKELENHLLKLQQSICALIDTKQYRQAQRSLRFVKYVSICEQSYFPAVTEDFVQKLSKHVQVHALKKHGIRLYDSLDVFTVNKKD